eukprot:gene25300-31740_t
METLIKLGADVNRRNKDGAAAIHFAAGDGGVSRMKILHAAGADLSAHSNFGGSPIHWAAGKGRAEAIAFLIAHKVDVNAVSPEGVPPVIMASVSACDQGVKHLVDAGADVGLIVSGGLTALHICAEHGLLAAVTSILNTPTGVNSANLETVDGNKPIHLAAMSAHRGVVRALLPFTAGIETNETDVEAQIDAIVANGKVRLQQWESKYNPPVVAASTSGADTDLTSPQSVTAEDDASAEKLKDIGNNLFKKAAYAAAIKAYTSAIELNRHNATYYSNRSAAYLTMGDNQNALQDAEMCRRLKPDWTKGCYRLGAARLALGLYEDAAVAAFEGCKLDDKNQELKLLLQTCVKKDLHTSHHTREKSVKIYDPESDFRDKFSVQQPMQHKFLKVRMIYNKVFFAVALCNLVANAHVCMWAPTQRNGFNINTPGESLCYLKEGPCGGVASADPVTTLVGGQDFTILFQQNLNHFYIENPGKLVADFANNANPVEADFIPLGLPVADYNA